MAIGQQWTCTRRWKRITFRKTFCSTSAQSQPKAAMILHKSARVATQAVSWFAISRFVTLRKLKCHWKIFDSSTITMILILIFNILCQYDKHDLLLLQYSLINIMLLLCLFLMLLVAQVLPWRHRKRCRLFASDWLDRPCGQIVLLAWWHWRPTSGLLSESKSIS